MRFIVMFVTAVQFVCYFSLSYNGQRKRIFKYTVNQGCMSLSSYYLEYGRHVARLRRRRRRAYVPTSNTTAHDNYEKINSWVSFSPYGHGAPLGYKGFKVESLRVVTFRAFLQTVCKQARSCWMIVTMRLMITSLKKERNAPGKMKLLKTLLATLRSTIGWSSK